MDLKEQTNRHQEILLCLEKITKNTFLTTSDKSVGQSFRIFPFWLQMPLAVPKWQKQTSHISPHCVMTTFTFGRLLGPVGTFSIFFRTNMPSTTCPEMKRRNLLLINKIKLSLWSIHTKNRPFSTRIMSLKLYRLLHISIINENMFRR